MNIQRYISRLEDEKLAIFLFHGVIKENPFEVRNYNRKHIFEHEFYELLNSLRQNGSPISIEEIVCGEKIPPKAFIISFDDGFENNYSVAAPILEGLNIPAVFYITSSFVDQNLMSWVDQIDFAVENATKEKISLSFFEMPILISTNKEKIDFLDKIRILAKGDISFFMQKERYIKEIFDACHVKECVSHTSSLDLKRNWEQVTELDKKNLFTIGGHTHTHPIMSYLNASELENEISTCLDFLEHSCLQKIKHFSYPEGLGHCYNAQVIGMLKNKGILCSPTAIDGVNSFNEDLFNLKRITVV